MDKTKLWYKLPEIAKHFGVGRDVVNRWVKDGLLLAHKFGSGKGIMLVSFSDLQTFIAKSEVVTEPKPE